LSPVSQTDTVPGMTRQLIHTFSFTFVFCLVSTFPMSAALTVRGRSPVAEKLVAAVIRADYQGDRAGLARLESELGAVPKAAATDARVTYWRGFALWRRAINGFNDSVPPAELDADLVRAIAHFDDSAKQDPAFAEPVIGKLSCLGYRAFLARGNATLSSEILTEYKTAIAAGQRMAKDNPRFVWAVGPSQWYIASTLPEAERPAKQAAVIESYEKGLATARAEKSSSAAALMPTWGEPELLMNIAWSHLNKTTPDRALAEKYAREALKLVPDWRYVRDILLPQIAKTAKGV
jgi:hypothetical protein